MVTPPIQICSKCKAQFALISNCVFPTICLPCQRYKKLVNIKIWISRSLPEQFISQSNFSKTILIQHHSSSTQSILELPLKSVVGAMMSGSFKIYSWESKKKVPLTLKQHFSQNSIVMQHYLSEIGLEYSMGAILSQKIWNF